MMDDERDIPEDDRIEVSLKGDEIAALEGWREANQLPSREAAARHLIKLGLLSEIGRIYQAATTQDDTH
jgi:uncharacterized protein YuzE